MKIQKILSYKLNFKNNLSSDFFLATALYSYIVEKELILERYIGYDEIEMNEANK